MSDSDQLIGPDDIAYHLELTAAQLGGAEGMPMGMPTHIGTPGGPAGAPPSVGVPGTHIGPPGGQPPPNAGPPGGGAPNMQAAARNAQGNQKGPIVAGGGPQTANAVSNTPGPNAKLSPGPG